MSSKNLQQLSTHSIGGGWGQEAPDDKHTEKVAIIRGTDIPRITHGDVSSVPFRWETPSKVKSRLLQAGDIVIEVSGGSAASGQHTGRALYITQETLNRLGGAVIPASFCRLLRLDQMQIDARYFCFEIAGMHLSGEIAEYENQSTGIANFQFTRFLADVTPKIEVIEEQREVAAVLGALDDRITLLRETNKTLEAIAQAIFKSWFIDFDPVRAKLEGRAPAGMDEEIAALFPDELMESELGLVPKGWYVKTVGDVVETVGGATPDTKNPDYWEPAEHNWTSPKDLSGLNDPVLLSTERRISSSGLSKIGSGLLPSGTLLMSSRAPIGYLAISDVPIAINQGYIAIPPGSQLSPLYMLRWCQANMEGIKGRANGSTFMEISKKAFRPIPILLPNSKLLDLFEETCGTLFDRLVLNSKQAQTLCVIRDSLLPRLISGRLRVGVAAAAEVD